MYKDPDKQREANRQAQARFKAKNKLVGHDVLNPVTQSCAGISEQGITSEGITKPDVSVVMAYNRTMTRLDNEKRGKDIKVFEDLPPDVQQTIAMISRRDGKIDPIEKANRTAIAVHYQRLFPGRYHSTGIAI